ncbi:MAG: phage antirepressor KilAC domain-containing protein [Parabacteroides sp.]|nr:phage antirepressor KilAC domain-containing protein [Parabacteroides sp.]
MGPPNGVKCSDHITCDYDCQCVRIGLYRTKRHLQTIIKKPTGQLRSVRKHGAYMTQSTLEQALTSPDFLIQLAIKLKEEQTKSAMLEEKNLILEEQNRVAAPKVEYHDTVLMSADTSTTNQIAKELGISAVRKALFVSVAAKRRAFL